MSVRLLTIVGLRDLMAPMAFIARILVVLAILSTTAPVANADAPANATMSKSQLLDAFMALPTTQPQPIQTIENVTKSFIQRDFRIPYPLKAEATQKLQAGIPVNSVRDQLRTLVDQNFSTEELDYLIKLRSSAFGLKMETVVPKIMFALGEYTRGLAKEQYESATHLKYVEPQKPNGEGGKPFVSSPSWYTKLIWDWIPSTKFCPPPRQ